MWTETEWLVGLLVIEKDKMEEEEVEEQVE